jgi:hypothetical protein
MLTNNLANVLDVMQKGLRVGHVGFRFEGVSASSRQVALWVELEARREDGTWKCVMTTGDGQQSRKEFLDADAEKELTDALLAIHKWLTEKEPKN